MKEFGIDITCEIDLDFPTEIDGDEIFVEDDIKLDATRSALEKAYNELVKNKELIETSLNTKVDFDYADDDIDSTEGVIYAALWAEDDVELIDVQTIINKIFNNNKLFTGSETTTVYYGPSKGGNYYEPPYNEEADIDVTCDAYIESIDIYVDNESVSEATDPFVPDKGKGVDMFNQMMGEALEDKLFEIVYKVYGKGDAIHSKIIKSIDVNSAIERFYDIIDEQMKTPIIVASKLVRG